MRHLSVSLIALAFVLVGYTAQAGWMWGTAGVSTPAGFGFVPCRVPFNAAHPDGCSTAPPVTWNGQTLPNTYMGPTNLNSYATSYTIVGKGWNNSSLQTGTYQTVDHNIPSVDYPTGVDWRNLQIWAALQVPPVTFPTLSSTVALDDPLYDQSGHSHGVGWDVTHARPPGCAVNTLPYVPGVSTALSPKYQVNCTGSGNFDLEGWDFGDKYQPGGIPATINSTSGWCKYANNNMDDSANTWALGYNADMVKVSGCPLNSVMSDPTHNGIVMINNYFDYKANTTWVGGFTMGIYINSALGSKAFKYNHWGNATYRPVEINGTCVDGNEIDAFYNDQSVAWQITGLTRPMPTPA